jgi:hypothetical protein
VNERHLSKTMRWPALLLCGGLVAPTLTQAAAQAPDAHALGVTEAILSYCAKIDAPAAAEYGQRAKALAQGASEETLAKMRAGDEYQKAHQSAEDFVAKVDAHNAKRVCSESVASK